MMTGTKNRFVHVHDVVRPFVSQLLYIKEREQASAHHIMPKNAFFAIDDRQMKYMYFGNR